MAFQRGLFYPYPHRKGPLFISKQLAFQKVFRNSATINGDKGSFGTGATEMNALCDQFLTGTALARDENGCIVLAALAAVLKTNSMGLLLAIILPK